MTFYFGHWVKEQREIRELSQMELSLKTEGEIPQSTISSWERRKIISPTVHNVSLISKAFEIPLSNVPWDYINFEEVTNDSRCSMVKEKFSLYDLPSASSLKTFEGKVYELKGFVGVERESGEIIHVTELYYRTRTVVSDSKVLAKRKNKNDDLMKVNRSKKVK